MKKTHMTEKRSNMLVPTVVAGAVVLVLGVMAQPVYAQEISGDIVITDSGTADDPLGSPGDTVVISDASASDLTVTDGGSDTSDTSDTSAALTVTGNSSSTEDSYAALKVADGGVSTDSLTSTGETNLGGTLDVAGNTTIGTPGTPASLTVNGNTGPDSETIDVAVTITGTRALHVRGASQLGEVTIGEEAEPAALNADGEVVTEASAGNSADLTVTGATNLYNTVTIGRPAVAATAGEDTAGNAALAEQSASLEVLGTTTTRGLTSSAGITNTGDLTNTGTVTVQATPSAVDDVADTAARVEILSTAADTGADDANEQGTTAQLVVGKEAVAGTGAAGTAALAGSVNLTGGTLTVGTEARSGTNGYDETAGNIVLNGKDAASDSDDAALKITGNKSLDVAGTSELRGATTIGTKAVAGTIAAGETDVTGAANAVEATLDVTGATNLHKDVVIGREAVAAVAATSGAAGSGAIAEQAANLKVLGTTTTRGLSSSGNVTIGTAGTITTTSSGTTTTTPASPANLNVLGVTTIGMKATSSAPAVAGGLMVYGDTTTSSTTPAIKVTATKALEANGTSQLNGHVTIGVAEVKDSSGDVTTAAVPANLTVNGDTTFNGDVAFKGGIDFGDNAVSVSNDRGNGITTTTAGETAVTGGDDNAAKVALDSDTASLTLRNPSNGEDHGVVIKPTSTTISGGTTSTSLTLNDDEVKFSNEADGTGGPVKVTGIADGTGPYDAVNFGQLQDLESQLSKGVAATTAAANIPQVAPGKTMSVGAGLGGYNGEVAVAVGLHYRLAENAVVRATVATGGKKAAYGLGAALSW